MYLSNISNNHCRHTYICSCIFRHRTCLSVTATLARALRIAFRAQTIAKYLDWKHPARCVFHCHSFLARTKAFKASFSDEWPFVWTGIRSRHLDEDSSLYISKGFTGLLLPKSPIEQPPTIEARKQLSSKHARKRQNISNEISLDELAVWLYALTTGYKEPERLDAIMEKFLSIEEFAKKYDRAITDPALLHTNKRAAYARR